MIKFGQYALVSKEYGYITEYALKASKLALNREIKKYFKRGKGKRLWLRIHPNISISKKPPEIRLGRGKGLHSYYLYKISPKKVIFEIIGTNTLHTSYDKPIIHKLLNLAASKLPIKTRIISI